MLFVYQPHKANLDEFSFGKNDEHMKNSYRNIKK